MERLVSVTPRVPSGLLLLPHTDLTIRALSPQQPCWCESGFGPHGSHEQFWQGQPSPRFDSYTQKNTFSLQFPICQFPGKAVRGQVSSATLKRKTEIICSRSQVTRPLTAYIHLFWTDLSFIIVFLFCL